MRASPHILYMSSVPNVSFFLALVKHRSNPPKTLTVGLLSQHPVRLLTHLKTTRYDAIHNAHLGLSGLGALYAEAKVLADAVIPNE